MSLFFDSVLINTVPLFIGIAKRLWEHTLLQKSVYQILIDAHSQSNHKKSLLISQEAFVDNSIEISNISLTPRDFLNTLKVINLILEDDC